MTQAEKVIVPPGATISGFTCRSETEKVSEDETVAVSGDGDGPGIGSGAGEVGTETVDSMPVLVVAVAVVLVFAAEDIAEVLVAVFWSSPPQLLA
ncbi:MAG: hypothetical protein ACYDGS_00070 [Thermoleophilia bacterium]